MTYRLPTKIRRFGITDPFLILIIAKYENEIPWGTGINDEASLTAFVTNSMLSQQKGRIEFPPQSGSRHCFVSPQKLDAASMLRSDAQLDPEDRDIICLILAENGKEDAAIALARIVNERKRVVFSQWIRLFEEHYAHAPAFVALLLRPLLETSRADTRRTVVPPSSAVVNWLYQRIQRGAVVPNENIARAYAWKLSSGAHMTPATGWQHIPRGIENTSRLVAACAGSGWCVADWHFARDYLSTGHFYLLRDEGRPVVALRTSGDGLSVIECQGRYNQQPVEWFEDITLFVRTAGLQMRAGLSNGFPMWHHSLVAGQSQQWWLERCRRWPFAVSAAPAEVQSGLGRPEEKDITPWMGAPFFESLLADAGIELDRKDWAGLLRLDPARLARVPEQHREATEILQACIDGWLARIRSEEFTLDDNALIPPQVAGDARLAEALKSVLIVEACKQVRKRPRTAMERLQPFHLDDVLPASRNESFAIAVERSLNALLTREDEHFGDGIFDVTTRCREDFDAVREAAWQEAILTQPPLLFALPEDLANTPGCMPHENKPSRVDLDAWREKVVEKPWLLTQKTGVPKSIRHHRCILEAYFDGWIIWLSLRPSRIWVKRGYYARVYMSYALLANPSFPDRFAKAWRAHRLKLHDRWNEASHRMQVMPVFQVSVLRMLGNLRAEQMSRQELNTCSAIARLQNTQAKADARNMPYASEVLSRLKRAGFHI